MADSLKLDSLDKEQLADLKADLLELRTHKGFLAYHQHLLDLASLNQVKLETETSAPDFYRAQGRQAVHKQVASSLDELVRLINLRLGEGDE